MPSFPLREARGGQRLMLSTLHEEEYEFRSPSSVAVAELVAMFLEGLKERSVFAMALQDRKATGTQPGGEGAGEGPLMWVVGGRLACARPWWSRSRRRAGTRAERGRGHKALRVTHGQGPPSCKIREFRRALSPSKVKGTEGCPSSGSRGRASQVTSPCSAHHPHSHRYPVLQTRIGGSEEERSLSRAA